MGLVVNLDPFVIRTRGLVVSRGSHATESGRHTVSLRGLRKHRRALDRFRLRPWSTNYSFLTCVVSTILNTENTDFVLMTGPLRTSH